MPDRVGKWRAKKYVKEKETSFAKVKTDMGEHSILGEYSTVR